MAGAGRVLHFVADSVRVAVRLPGSGGATALPLERFFSQADNAAIEAAVRDVESRSAGEIVPYAVERSDLYTRAVWTAATLGGLAGALGAAILRWAGDFWGGHVALWIALPPEMENAANGSRYVLPKDVPHEGSVRVILGAYGGQQSPIALMRKS